jgi:hypothetical protein
MQNYRTSVGSLVVLGTLAVMGWGAFLMLILKEQKPVQIPAPVVNVAPAPTPRNVVVAPQEEEEDMLLSVGRLTGYGLETNGKKPTSMVSLAGSGYMSSGSQPIGDTVDRIVKENAKDFDVRILLDLPAGETEVAAALKSPKRSKLIDWRVLQVQKDGIEWRIRLPFARVADPKARQLVEAERERRIKKIVAAAESGGNG